nr:EamA family transporter [Candidatus Nitrosotalea okcheonensis]
MDLTKTTASDASILLNGETVFIVLFAILLFKEKLEPLGYLVIILVLIDVIVITTNLEFSNFLSDLKKEGNLLILSAAICYALDNNLSRIVSHRVDISRLVRLRSIIRAAYSLLLYCYQRYPPT